jgi:hypothetical protein
MAPPQYIALTDEQMGALANSRPGQPLIAPCPGERTWISIELRDQDQKPVAGERYLLRLPDFSQLDGSLDAAGKARVDGLMPGTCQVCFPDIDAREWFPA